MVINKKKMILIILGPVDDVFFAYKIPEKCNSIKVPNSHVNVMRFILNCLNDLDLEYLTDTQYIIRYEGHPDYGKAIKLVSNENEKKILIFIISYKASYRILDVYNQIPFKKLKKFEISVLVSDDCSNDDTVEYIKKINKNKIFVNVNKYNMGYGSHIKKCLDFALKNLIMQ